MVSGPPLTLSRAQQRQLTAILAYVFDDEQDHAFNDPDARRTHIYWRAIRPLALRTGFRSRAQLRVEESQWASARPRSRPFPRSSRSRSARAPSAQLATHPR